MAQVCSGVSGVLVLRSLYLETKEEMLKWQAVSGLPGVVAFLLLGGWSSAILCVLAGVRGLCTSGKTQRVVVVAVWCMAAFITVVWEKEGILPLAGAAVYTVVSYYCSLKWTKAALAFSAGLRFFYCFIIGAYPLAVLDFVALLVVLVSAGGNVEGGRRLFSLKMPRDRK